MPENTTALFTVLGRTSVFVVRQLAVKFILEPIQDVRQLIGEILASLTFYGSITSATGKHYFAILQKLEKSKNPSDVFAIERTKDLIKKTQRQSDEAQPSRRNQASQLRGKANVILCFNLIASLGFLPNHENIQIISAELIGLSNSLHASN